MQLVALLETSFFCLVTALDIILAVQKLNNQSNPLDILSWEQFWNLTSLKLLMLDNMPMIVSDPTGSMNRCAMI